MSSHFKKISLLAILILAGLTAGNPAFGQTLKSKYFTITIRDGINVTGLLEKMSANYFLRMKTAFAGAETGANATSGTMLADALDAMYLEISDIMDIHMYSFEIDLVVVPDKDSMADILKQYANAPAGMPSFYQYENNRIYISYQDATAGMLAHEIAHAITSHYFVVPPPEKLQEVLSGFVEYSIRKHTGTNTKPL